jgi:hypothetical protein
MTLFFFRETTSGILARMAIFGTETGPLSTTPLLGGDAGTEQTIWKLRGLLDDAWKDSFVNRTAIDIVRGAGVLPFDSWGQIRAIYNWILTNFYFVNDPVTKEAVRPTKELLELMAGDCDDINANMIPALLGTIGYETRFVTVAADADRPNLFSHIYVEVNVDGYWYPLDAARPGAQMGLAPRFFFRRDWWSTIDGSHAEYPENADGEMAGYVPAGVRGLNGLAEDVTAIFQGASTTLRSVSGQSVQNVVGSTIGPGGAVSVSPPASVFSLSSGTGELFILAAIGLGLWWVMKD